ncbi:MAG: secretin N-terminal domain-containing protein [Campylobacterota bacterium]|nr:secretin N-terminal domain-containing protein [Campylobacterota bacterium]
MKLDRFLAGFVLIIGLNLNIFASQSKEQININFKDLEITDFIKITSKIVDKNILLTSNIKGKVDFISNKPVYTDDILNILVYVLESKGYTLIENDGILRVVRLTDAAKYNIPVYNNSSQKTHSIITEVFNVEHSNVDYISSKIRHLISKSAKLVTDKESNAVILTDFQANVATVKNVISLIAKDSKKDIQTVQLNNLQGSSVLTDLKTVAKTVFNEKILTEKVDILLNKDTNTIMFVGKKQNVDFLVKYLKEIEQKGSLVEKIVDVVYLKNAESKNVIKIITDIIAKKAYKDKDAKPFASTDEESNSIILMGPKDELSYFKKLIDKLDKDRQQVYVKARIIEVSDAKTKEIGVKYGLTGFNAANAGLVTFNSALNGLGNVPVLSLEDATNFNFDVSTMTKGLSLGASINLLNQNGAADIVSEPSLLCINNKESSIYVGETRSIKTGTTTTSGGNINDTYKREDIGLTLKVKPRISTGNKVLLDISTKLEDVAQTQTNDQPNTTKKDLVTTAIVNNGESVILGGYIKEKSENTVHSVPILGKIPVIGELFKNNNEINDKINLVIIITPYIVPKSKDLTYVREQLAQLKLLEEKYTKDTMIRLQRQSINAKLEDIKREKKRKDLEEQNSELQEQIDKEKQNNNLSSNNSLHNNRVNSLIGH